jgi:phospholipid/cholesterol/gamma-HCH transport system substrate-binding protein
MADSRFTSRAVPVVTVLLIVLGFGVTSCGFRHQTRSAQFCALMSDSVGLYHGNPVTHMGYKVGTVTTIEPRDNEVKVTFAINGDVAIPRSVRAVTRSPSILADRSLELVGNYSGGPRLAAGDCIPRNRSSTPLSISQAIGSATRFVNGISPAGSTNLQDALHGIDEAFKGNGVNVNKLLTTSSQLLDNPDQTVADLGAITRNMAELTSMLKAQRDPLKQIIQAAPITTPDLLKALDGAANLVHPLAEIFQAINDIELRLGPEIQLTLDEVSDLLRVFSPHYKGLADMLNPLPRFISGLAFEPPGASAGALAKHINDHVFYLIRWRPPLFRIPTEINGLIACGKMNASLPGSCTDVGGKPYAVDVALLQYVLTEAQRR